MPVTSSSPVKVLPGAKERIKGNARELGFDDCRITTAGSPNSSNQFERWLAQSRHGEMAYMARNAAKRTDLQKVLPAAKSVITLAVSYRTQDGRTETAPHASRITHHETTQHGLIA